MYNLFTFISEFLFTLKTLKRIDIIACGSAYHAGMVGKYVFEEMLRIPTSVDYASEYRYRNPITGSDTLTIIISQSGETADTLAAFLISGLSAIMLTRSP